MMEKINQSRGGGLSPSRDGCGGKVVSFWEIFRYLEQKHSLLTFHQPRGLWLNLSPGTG